MPEKKFNLIGLKLNEVSFVDEGANPGAKIALIKRKEKSESNAEGTKLNKGEHPMTPEEMAAKIAEMEDNNLALTAKLEELSTENAKLKQDASEAGQGDPNKEAMTPEEMASKMEDMTDEEKAAFKMENPETAAKMEEEEAAKQEDDESPSMVAANKRLDKLAKSNAQLQDQVNKMHDREEVAKYADLAGAYSNFPVEPEKIGKLLRIVNKNQEASDTLERLLTSGNEAIAMSMTALGSTSVNKNYTSAESEFYAIRDEVAKTQKVNKHKAMQIAKKEHPEKWKAMRDSQIQH